MKPILQKDAPVLRKVALAVEIDSITSSKIQKIITEMRVALDSQDDGVAIAAPQIGYSLRIFVVSPKVTELSKNKKGNRENGGGKNISEDKPEENIKDTVFINPYIKKLSKEKKSLEEGCLSVRYLYGQVERSTKATVEAYDIHGKKFTKGASGLLAQIFQHEIDHLDGVLFIDKAKYVENIPPENPQNNLSKKIKNAKQ